MRRLLCVAVALSCARAAPAPRTCDAQPTAAALRKAGLHGDRALLFGGRSVQATGQRVAIGRDSLHRALSHDGTIADDSGAKRIEIESRPGFSSRREPPLHGGWPTDLALSPDGARVRTGAQIGALPAGFRPTALLLTDAGQTLHGAHGRGFGTAPDQAGSDKSDLPRGTLQRISPIPSGAALQQATDAAAALAAPREFVAPSADCARVGPLPAARGGDPQLSSIHHVLYVLEENKAFAALSATAPAPRQAMRRESWKARPLYLHYPAIRAYLRPDAGQARAVAGPTPLTALPSSFPARVNPARPLRRELDCSLPDRARCRHRAVAGAAAGRAGAEANPRARRRRG